MPKLTDQEYAGMVRAMMADGETLESAQARANAFENDEPEPGQEIPSGPAEGLLANGRKDITAGGKTVSEALFNKGATDATWRQNLMSGATKGVTSTALGVGKLVNKGESALLLPIERFFGVDTTKRQAELDRQNQAVEDLFASGKLSGETTAESVGKGVEQAAEFLTPLGAAGKAAKATEIAAAAAKTAPKTVRFAKGIGEFLSGTARATPLASAQAGGNEGEGLVNAAMGEGVGKIARVGGGMLGSAGKKLWEKLVPTSAQEAAAASGKGLDLGGAVSQTPGLLGIKGVFGSRAGLTEALEAQAGKLGDEVSKVIDDFAAANPGKTFSVPELVAKTESEILSPENEKRLMSSLGIDRTGIVSALNAVGQKLSGYSKAYGEDLTPQALQSFKQELQAAVKGAYKKAALGQPLKSEEVEATKALASQARKAIADAIPETGPLNKQLSPILEALDVLRKKGEYSGFLTDTIAAAGAGGGTLYNTGDPIQAAKAAIVGVLAKRAATSPLARSVMAKALSELDKLAQKVPGQAVVAGTKGDAGNPSPLESTIENYLNPAK